MDKTSYETSETLSALIEKVDALSIKMAKLEKVVNKIGEELSHTSMLLNFLKTLIMVLCVFFRF